MTNRYDEAFARSINDPEGFWGDAAEDIHWIRKWDKVLDDSNKPFYRWFVGGQLNTCYNAVDFHIDNGRGDQPAMIYDSPVTDTIKPTPIALRDKVAAFAGALAEQGVDQGGPGHRLHAHDPRGGCGHAGLCPDRRGSFGGFRRLCRQGAGHPHQRRQAQGDRFGLLRHRGQPGHRLQAAAGRGHRPLGTRTASRKNASSYQRPMEKATMVAGRDLDWEEAAAAAAPADCVPVEATDPLYILYTSGTTGQPKGVVRDNGGHAVALKWTMKNIYNVDAGDVYWAASDVGWVVGHSYIVYAPLFRGCTTILFEGKPVGTPDAGVFWRVISQHKVKCMFTAPTAFRAIKREDPSAELMKQHDLSKFEALFLAGERTDPDTLKWAVKTNLKVPVIDHWWQTETGWAICANCMGIHEFPVKEGSPTKPAPGWNLQVVDANNQQVPAGEIGALVVKLPLPPGTLPTLWNNDDRFIESYLEEFPGYYKTADAGYIDSDGYAFVMSRTDDIINVAGHRLSTGAMEEVLADHPDVAECAVLGVDDQLKGQLPIGFLVLNAGVDRDHGEIVSEVVQMVGTASDRWPPSRPPRWSSGCPKPARARSWGTIQKIADNKEFKVPATIDDPTILGEMEEALTGIGYAKGRK
jgi:propionyl-CoA synthetase